jgi:outer membrane lipoprotein SlyB
MEGWKKLGNVTNTGRKSVLITVAEITIILGASAVGAYTGLCIGGAVGALVGALVGAFIGSFAVDRIETLKVKVSPNGDVYVDLRMRPT